MNWPTPQEAVADVRQALLDFSICDRVDAPGDRRPDGQAHPYCVTHNRLWGACAGSGGSDA
ncbi:hypothetical protein [Pseudactinotalea terrae]|uniref:hypothetical protein n=1 Tax=Pseudactinotalea terrae TaxID=1743262 RepID=UPI0012E1E2C1|nr:hypothetical protein [Pseudactinotalea terrae]